MKRQLCFHPMKLSHPEVKHSTSKVTFSLWTEAQKSKIETLAACAHSSRISVQGLKTQHKVTSVYIQAIWVLT